MSYDHARLWAGRVGYGARFGRLWQAPPCWEYARSSPPADDQAQRVGDPHRDLVRPHRPPLLLRHLGAVPVARDVIPPFSPARGCPHCRRATGCGRRTRGSSESRWRRGCRRPTRPTAGAARRPPRPTGRPHPDRPRRGPVGLPNGIRRRGRARRTAGPSAPAGPRRAGGGRAGRGRSGRRPRLRTHSPACPPRREPPNA